MPIDLTWMTPKARDEIVNDPARVKTKKRPDRNRLAYWAGGLSRTRFESDPHFPVYADPGTFTIPSLPLTAEQLRHHAKRYGSEGIEEVALAENVSLDGELAKGVFKPQRRTTKALETWVLGLCRSGMLFCAVASTTNVSEDRVRSTSARAESS
jgi:hypothetical protein